MVHDDATPADGRPAGVTRGGRRMFVPAPTRPHGPGGPLRPRAPIGHPADAATTVRPRDQAARGGSLTSDSGTSTTVNRIPASRSARSAAENASAAFLFCSSVGKFIMVSKLSEGCDKPMCHLPTTRPVNLSGRQATGPSGRRQALSLVVIGIRPAVRGGRLNADVDNRERVR